MLKEGYSKEDMEKFGREYAVIRKEINQIYGLNQEIINWPNHIKKDEILPVGKKILGVIQPLKKMLIKYQGHMFCCLLQQVDFDQSQTPSQTTLLSKLVQSLLNFVKFKTNIANQGIAIWELAKYFYCYQQGMNKHLSEFKTDFQLIDRLKSYYVGQYKDKISDSVSRLKDLNPSIMEPQTAKNWQTLLKLSKQILSITNTSKDIKQLNNCINSLLLSVPIHHCQQIQFNNLKQLYQEQLLRQNKRKLPCCSVYFHRNQKLQLNSHKYNDYEEIIKMPLNAQAENTIRKVMISFLNTDGGIHYIGIKKEENQLNVQGIWMNDTNLIEIFKKVHRIAIQIEPGNEISLKEQPKIPLNINQKLTYSLQLTRFVSVEVNPLVDKQHGNIDYVETHHDKKAVRISVVKIKVRAAPKYDTYMVKGGKGIESWYRDDGLIKKILPSQFPKIFTQRSMQYMNQDYDTGNPECPNCRHQYQVEDY